MLRQNYDLEENLPLLEDDESGSLNRSGDTVLAIGSPLPEHTLIAPDQDGNQNTEERQPTNAELLEEIVLIRPTVDAPDTRLTPLGLSMLILRFTLANNTGNARNPILAQPWRDTLDYGTINASRDVGIGLYYVFSSDWNDILQRLRSEGRGNAGLGLLANTAKIIVASVPPALAGLGIGALLKYYETEINAGPNWLKILTTPPASRLIAASIISPLLYIASRKVIDKVVPPPDFKFNQTPALNPLQQIALVGFRIYDATVNFEFIRLLILGFGGEAILHNRFFPAGVILVDQLLVHFIDPIAFRRHTFDTVFPFDEEMQARREHEAHQAVLLGEDDEEDTLIAEVDRYADGRGNVYHQSHDRRRMRCDSVTVGAWYAGRMLAAVAAGVAVTYAISAAVEDPESLNNDSARMSLVSVVAMATVLVERAIEDGVPWLYHHAADTVSSCWSSLFSRSNNEQADNLLVEEERPSLEEFATSGATL